MKNIKLLLFGIGTLLALWIASWFGLFSFISQNPASQTSPETSTLVDPNQASLEASQASVLIDFGDGKDVNGKVNIVETTTAYSALAKLAEENNLEIVSQKYDFGVFVESIDGYESGADKAWIYFVNGQSGQVSADQYQIKSSDVVEWKYITPSGE